MFYPDTQPFGEPSKNPARHGAIAKARGEVYLDEGKVDKKQAAADTKSHGLRNRHSVVVEQIGNHPVFAMGGLAVFKIYLHIVLCMASP